MGKRRREQQGSRSGTPHKDAFMRINFLYQAAHVHLSAQPTRPQLARFYIRTMRTVAKKLVLRLGPSIKRTICKVCCTPLLPGVTATVRQRSRREKHTVVSCLTCGRVKRFHKWIKPSAT